MVNLPITARWAPGNGRVCQDGLAWRAAFTAGLLGGGAVLRALLPGVFYALADDYPWWRTVVAGLLV